jgi:hypothetical protein
MATDRPTTRGVVLASLLVALLLVVATAGATLGVAWLIWGDDDSTTQPSAPASPTETPEADADWRDEEYRRIASLAGGLSIDYFREVLGTQMFERRSPDGRFTEHLFRRPGYWVQAIADADGAVGLMTVTSCVDEFRPRFEGQPPPSFPRLGTVVLNESHFADTETEPSRVRYFTSGATANSYYYDEYYLGNPGNYKTYFVGINDACPYQLPEDSALAIFEAGAAAGALEPTDPRVATLRAGAVANTYGETAPFFDESALDAFQIGADRILTRTAPPLPDDPATPPDDSDGPGA